MEENDQDEIFALLLYALFLAAVAYLVIRGHSWITVATQNP